MSRYSIMLSCILNCDKLNLLIELKIYTNREEDIPVFSSLEEEVKYWKEKAAEFKEGSVNLLSFL